jgi:hypothetical protein
LCFRRVRRHVKHSIMVDVIDSLCRENSLWFMQKLKRLSNRVEIWVRKRGDWVMDFWMEWE